VPHVIWHLIYFINSLIEKTMHTRSQQLLDALVSSNIVELMNITDSVVRMALGEMLEGLIRTFSDSLYIV
jgi:hypothetical protein